MSRHRWARQQNDALRKKHGCRQKTGMRRAIFTLASLLAVSAIATDASHDEINAYDHGLMQGIDLSFWAYPEFASGHSSMGCIKVIYPVFNLDTGTAIKLKGGKFGRFLFGIWSQSDVSSHYHDRRRYAFQEIDPIIAYAYTWHFHDGWNLDSQLGAQWNFMDGYYGDGRHSYDEWQFWERLNTPWCTVYAGMRNFYLPVCKSFFRVGVTKSFPIVGNLSIRPNVWLDGGSERWNQQRVGYGEYRKKIGRGLNAVLIQLYLDYRISEWLSLYGGVTQHCAVGNEIRNSLGANPSRESKKDFLIVTMGAKLDF